MNKKKNTGASNFNSSSDPSLTFHHVGGTGRYTTSTTNLYHQDVTYRSRLLNAFPPTKLFLHVIVLAVRGGGRRHLNGCVDLQRQKKTPTQWPVSNKTKNNEKKKKEKKKETKNETKK
jgi:hypothetical protein